MEFHSKFPPTRYFCCDFLNYNLTKPISKLHQVIYVTTISIYVENYQVIWSVIIVLVYVNAFNNIFTEATGL
jgi:hypothetical protein